ncbi:hypothetical protein TIFTF001_025325 [Ficus carica]|uniref:Uncharacterized protein n=1 Tax=Ficus carica TaxID=3494 RepID=A0AA88AMS4_FICCA|nr:hypothetical protein TIFTF001_025325 [Ficus carica]
MDGLIDKREVIIDIPEDLEFKQWSRCWIHRIPRNLRKVNEDSYTPQLISIGPFHHGKPEFKAMDSHKDKYKEELFKRIPGGESSKRDEIEKRIKNFISESAEDIRGRYAGTIDLQDPLFEEMILRDACFILEIFQRNDFLEESMTDYILSTPWLRKAVKLDLLLLENQLPFDVLQQLYDHFRTYLPAAKAPHSSVAHRMHPFLRLTCSFFKDHILTQSDWEKFADIVEVKHFTNLLREFWLPKKFMKKKFGQEDMGDKRYLYSATKLDKAGVTFERADKGTSLTDVKIFKAPILKFVPAINCMQLRLPELKLECDTECLLRNVMALEQCLYPKEDYICGYIALMDQLINTSEDVEFLVERKILTNLLGSNKEAARLFNGLCCKIPREKSFYAHYYSELNTFYENRWNVTRATLKKVYFKDLWTGSSTIVGLFVLLFTVTATTRNVYLR